MPGASAVMRPLEKRKSSSPASNAAATNGRGTLVFRRSCVLEHVHRRCHVVSRRPQNSHRSVAQRPLAKRRARSQMAPQKKARALPLCTPVRPDLPSMTCLTGRVWKSINGSPAASFRFSRRPSHRLVPPSTNSLKLCLPTFMSLISSPMSLMNVTAEKGAHPILCSVAIALPHGPRDRRQGSPARSRPFSVVNVLSISSWHSLPCFAASWRWSYHSMSGPAMMP